MVLYSSQGRNKHLQTTLRIVCYECIRARSTAGVCTVLATNETVLILTTLRIDARLLRWMKGLQVYFHTHLDRREWS